MKGKLLRFWQHYTSWSITAEGEITWWAGDDIHLRKRKLDHEIQLPKWAWRPYCWYRDRHDNYYGACVYCDKILGYPESKPSAKALEQSARPRLRYGLRRILPYIRRLYKSS